MWARQAHRWDRRNGKCCISLIRAGTRYRAELETFPPDQTISGKVERVLYIESVPTPRSVVYKKHLDAGNAGAAMNQAIASIRRLGYLPY
jgi:hypothetical protein